MPSSTVVVEIARLWAPSNLRKVAPGTAVCAVVAAFAYFIDKRGLTHFEALFIPPLIITEEQLREGFAVLDEALKITDQKAG